MFSALDSFLTEWLYQNVGLNSRPAISNAPYYLGLLPYELYVLPGMFLAILVMLFKETPAPVQFHLLPHWFAYSMSMYLKKNVDRVRPGCERKEKGKRIDPKHCEEEPREESFPSGHTLIAFSLLIALFLFLLDPTYNASGEKWIFGEEGWVRTLTLIGATVVAINVAIHRVSFGYHHVSDVVAGAIIGSSIGFISYYMCNRLRGEQWPLSGGAAATVDWHRYFMLGEKTTSTTTTDTSLSLAWTSVRAAGCLFSLWGIWIFFARSFRKLSELRH